MYTDSHGIGTVTNSGSTYHYRGHLLCTTTCPGPEPSGCSVTDTLGSWKEIPPGQARNCNMFATTDPCCNDDGHFYLAATFSPTEYRSDPNAAWTPLPPTFPKAALGAEQDGGSGNPNPDNSPIHQSHISLDARCNCKWLPGCDPNANNPYANDPPGSGGFEQTMEVKNETKRHNYLVRIRVAGYCPADDPNQPYCACNCGYCKSPPLDAECELRTNPVTPGDENCQLYPREFRYPPFTTTEPVCQDNSQDPDLVHGTLMFMDPDDWTDVSENPNTPTPGHWPYCVAVMNAGQEYDVLGIKTLNSCCDVPRDPNRPGVRNIVLCAEVDTLQSQKHDQSFQNVNSPAFDRLARRRCVDDPNDIETMYDISCFSPLMDPRSTDPNAICNSPK